MTRKIPNYMPQLDSLRAFAVFAVMIHHWAPGFLGFGPWGDLGVRCFFVLSGFLITGILLRARDSVEKGDSSVAWELRQFYVRRSLRIFPIYYLTLLVGAFLGMHVLRETFWWHAGYGSNFYFAARGQWQGYISHLWSLSVEEQFYLVWPALVFLLPRRRLPVFFAACVGAALLWRAGLAFTLGTEHLALKVLLPSCLDSLVGGSLLAWAGASRPRPTSLPGPLQGRLFPAAIVLFTGLCVLDALDAAKAFRAVAGPLIETAFFVGIVGLCARGITGIIGRVLDWAPIQYFGRISYGLYLYHMFAGYIAGMVANKFHLTLPGPGPAQFALFFTMSLTAAALSSRFIERPCNALKRFFPTGNRHGPGSVASKAGGDIAADTAKALS